MNEDEFYRRIAHWIGVQHGIKVDPESLDIQSRMMSVEFRGTLVPEGTPTLENIDFSWEDLVEAVCD